MSKYSEVRNNYTDDNNVRHIDAWLTSDDNENGTTIALIINGQVYYKDQDAITDKMAQVSIKQSIKEFENK